MANPAEPANLEQHLRQMIHSNESTMQARVPIPKPMVRLPPTRVLHNQSIHDRNVHSQHGPTSFSPHSQTYQQANSLSFHQNGGQIDGRNTNSDLSNQHQRRNYQSSQQTHHRTQSNNQRFMDSSSFDRGQTPRFSINRQDYNQRQLYNPQAPRAFGARELKAQYLNLISNQVLPKIEMSSTEYNEKEAFRLRLQQISLALCETHQNLPRFELQSFGSFKSGFATADSDMDLVIVNSDSAASAVNISLLHEDLPRALEKALLDAGVGARLLSRTRVPIIKVCEEPGEALLAELRVERDKWESLPHHEKYPHLYPDQNMPQEAVATSTTADLLGTDDVVVDALVPGIESVNLEEEKPANEQDTPDTAQPKERKSRSLNFPAGTGIQSDINFFNPLALQNTQLLRCYSACDPRVRPMTLFVKAWAKKRRVNSAYLGTLNSYGYVLMVLHYLANVAQPPVIPNLQQPWRPSQNCTPHGANMSTIDGWTVNFWSNEGEIAAAAQAGQMTRNQESLGSLLSGFFFYYGQQAAPAFNWMHQALSLRSPQGVITKEEKGWVKARTEEGDGRKVQYRYLFCIEDPFESDHNVARTVTHNGIVSIRDEFRRAVGILQQVARNVEPKSGLLDDLTAEEEERVDQRRPKRDSAPAVSRRQNGLNTRITPTTEMPNVQDNSAFPSLAGTRPDLVIKKVQTSNAARSITTSAKDTPVPEADKDAGSMKNPRSRGGRRQKRQNLDLTK